MIIPDWKKFISSGENIIRFLGDYINCQTYSSEQFSPRRAITLPDRLFSNPETVKMLNRNGMLDCSCLASTQEEADTRIILHALYSDQLYQENNVQGSFCHFTECVRFRIDIDKQKLYGLIQEKGVIIKYILELFGNI